MTSAELLRRAADKMRERATDVIHAHRACDPEKTGWPFSSYSPVFMEHAFAAHAPGDSNDPQLRAIWIADAQNLAAWQVPDVALGFAELLDKIASTGDARGDWGDWTIGQLAIDVARTYLGEPS